MALRKYDRKSTKTAILMELQLEETVDLDFELFRHKFNLRLVQAPFSLMWDEDIESFVQFREAQLDMENEEIWRNQSKARVEQNYREFKCTHPFALELEEEVAIW